MKLLDAIKNLDVENVKMINDILECLEERKNVIEDAEPMDYGYRYEKWEEKLSELDDIINDIESLINMSIKERKEKLENIKCDVIYYQFTYGGLKRLIV